MSFIDKKISTRHAIAILAKRGIEVKDDEAMVILNFLYLIAKKHTKDREEETPRS